MSRTVINARERRIVQAFSTQYQRWAPDTASHKPDDTVSFSVATQNTWFNELAWIARANGLLTAIEAAEVDFVCLQEVTPRLLDHLRKAPFVRENLCCVCSSNIATYDAFTGYGLGFGNSYGYGTMILSRLPIAAAWELQFDSRMQRTLLAAEVLTASGTLTIATSHLESQRPFSGTRVTQLHTVAAELGDLSDVIFMGDFNFDPQDGEENEIDSRFDDVWARLRPGDPGFTEDTARNLMRLQHYQQQKQVRYDRILAKLSRWAPREAGLFADQPLSDEGLCVSDHFGVTARFSALTR